MVSRETLDQLEKLGFGADVDALESYVEELQDAASAGTPLVSDAVYDAHFKLLKQLKPDSVIVNRNWEEDASELNEYDILLKNNPMCSITTFNSLDELKPFISVVESLGEPVSLMAALKENGHAIRAVYVNGYLYSGTTRGRYKKGRDITRHLKLMLPNYVPAWKDARIVEIRGEAIISIENFEKYMRGIAKHPLSSVTSLIRESASDEEIKLLDVICYKVLALSDELKFATLWDEYEHLSGNGFKTPQKALFINVLPHQVRGATERLLSYFEQLMEMGEIKYSSDGIVVNINDNEQFKKAGREGNTNKGNFALKAGKYWESNIYSSVIEDIEFVCGKSYITPKAKITPVITGNGSSVSTVPLYNVGVMERYGYVTGATVYFRYGGEQGVTTCDYNGNSVQIE